MVDSEKGGGHHIKLTFCRHHMYIPQNGMVSIDCYGRISLKKVGRAAPAIAAAAF